MIDLELLSEFECQSLYLSDDDKQTSLCYCCITVHYELVPDSDDTIYNYPDQSDTESEFYYILSLCVALIPGLPGHQSIYPCSITRQAQTIRTGPC